MAEVADPNGHTPVRSTRIASVSRFATQIAWHPGGKEVLYNSRPYENGPLRIYATDIRTFKTRELTHADGDLVGDIALSVAPDGRIGYFRTHNWNETEFWTLDPDNGESKLMAKFPYWVRSFAWSADSKKIMFARPPLYNALVEVDLETGAEKQMYVSKDLIEGPGYHPETGKPYWTEREMNTRILNAANPLLTGKPDTKPKIAVESTRYDWSPVVSPDGTRFAFISNRSGHQEIFVRTIPGGNPGRRSRLKGDGEPHHLTWGPNGESLFFDLKGRTYQLRPGEIHVSSEVDGEAYNPRAKKDAIYFASKKSGDWQLWSTSNKDSQPTMIHDHGWFSGEPFEGTLPGGEEAAYIGVKFHRKGIWITNKEGKERLLVEAGFAGPFNQWQQFENGIYMLSDEGRGPGVYFYEYATGTMTNVAQFRSRNFVSFSVTPDQQRIYYTLATTTGADIYRQE